MPVRSQRVWIKVFFFIDGDSRPTYVQQFRTGDHALLHTRVKKIDVIAQTVVTFDDFTSKACQFGLKHLLGEKTEYLLHPREHPRPQHEQTETPCGKLRRDVHAPPHRALLLEPHRRKRLLDVFEVKKEAKQKL